MLKVIITGVYRSGTTLIEKILHNHPSGIIGSQPFPFLYPEVKKLFNDKNNLSNTPYPINEGLGEKNFKWDNFSRYLDDKWLNASQLNRWKNNMKDYSGCHMKNFLNTELHSSVFKDVLVHIFKTIELNYPKSQVQFVGFKEILLEDFIPFALQNSIKTVLIIRDPRDVICSINHSEKVNHVGNRRPLLYTIRLWRKSVALEIQYKNHPNFISIKYEDLVQDTYYTLAKICRFLNVDNFSENFFETPILNQEREVWLGNSSFGKHEGLNPSSIGKYKIKMGKGELEFIEYLCSPEMIYAGYPVYSKNLGKASIYSYVENIDNLHRSFKESNLKNKTDLDFEIARLKMLSDNDNRDEKELGRYFFNKKIYLSLKKYFI